MTTQDEQLEKIRGELALIRSDIKRLESTTARLNSIVAGDDAIGLDGVMVRLRAAEDKIETIDRLRQQQAVLMRGIGIGLSLTTVTGIGTLITVIAQSFANTP